MFPSTRTALVTGASGGLGEEFARQLAAQGVNLLLVARREAELQTLASELRTTFGIQVHVLALDLSDPGSPAELQRECEYRRIQIDFLINNAGFGDYGHFSEGEPGRQLDMIQVNVATLTELTRRFLPGMLERGAGRILNVASLASFMPGPQMAVYHATKAYVLSLSEALAEELQGSGVLVTALCPGPVETGFKDSAGMERSRVFSSPLRHLWMLSAHEVARQGLEAMWLGKPVHVAGTLNAVQALVPRLVPRTQMSRMVALAQQEKPTE